MKRLILIFGPGRSGTSLVARVVSSIGADLGNNLIPGNNANPDGYFEDRVIVAHHKDLLAALGSADSFGATLPLPDDWLNHEAVPEIENKIAKYIAEKLRHHELAAIKDPRLSMILPLWQRIAARIEVKLKFIICVRHPAAMAASLAKAASIPRSVGEAMWIARIAYAFNYLNNDGVIINFDDMVMDPERSVRRICEYIVAEKRCSDKIFDQLMSSSLIKANYRHEPESYEVLHRESLEIYHAIRAAQIPGNDRQLLIALCNTALTGLRATPGRNDAIRGAMIRSQQIKTLDLALQAKRKEIVTLTSINSDLSEANSKLTVELEIIRQSHWMRLGETLNAIVKGPTHVVRKAVEFIKFHLRRTFNLGDVKDANLQSLAQHSASSSVRDTTLRSNSSSDGRTGSSVLDSQGMDLDDTKTMIGNPDFTAPIVAPKKGANETQKNEGETEKN
jgi:hypothetical protein